MPTTENNLLLQAKELRTWFEIKKWGFIHVGHVRAVDGVNFTLERGESVSLVGESGCGKSSLAKTIMGIHQPTEGELIFEGNSVDSTDEQSMRQYKSEIGFVQQDPYGALPPFMSIQRILEEPMIVNGIKDKDKRLKRIHQVMEELKMTPVEDFLKKYPHMLSGGQQQRVVIARSLVLNPKLIMADEPVSMLDASVRVEILELIKKIQSERELAVIYITHDLSTVRYFSERIWVMYGGKIVEQSPVRDLLKEPAHPYTRALLEAISEPDADNVHNYKKVPSGEPPSLLNPPGGCRFHPRCEYMIEGLCDQEIPPDFQLANDRLTACWLFRDEEEAGDVAL